MSDEPKEYDFPVKSPDLEPVDLGSMAVRLNLGEYHKKPPVRFTHERQLVYLENLARTGLKQRSAAAAGVSMKSVEYARMKNPAFTELEDEAYTLFTESLHDEAVSRARDGWDEPVYQQGNLVGYVRKKSDRLMELLLKAHRAEFGDRLTIDANIKHSGVLLVGDKTPTVDEWEQNFGAKSDGRFAKMIEEGKIVEGEFEVLKEGAFLVPNSYKDAVTLVEKLLAMAKFTPEDVESTMALLRTLGRDIEEDELA